MKNLRRRKWLNPVNSCHSGSIEYSILKEGTPKDRGIDASITVRDCSRSATLDFSVYPDRKGRLKNKEVNNALIKITRLRQSILEFEATYLELLNEMKDKD